ncbi:MAG: TPM domain-containing protein [Cytophagaceae bacterium]|nr:TPM domain-containing protein [Cytophagaceae bacterium]
MSAKHSFSEAEQLSIVQAIKEAEKDTSGEIRVHLDRTCSDDPYKKAIKVFENLAMHKTAQRNGVLFYLSIDDRKLAIIGDKGINEKVPADFWHVILEEMIQLFKQGKLAEGLAHGIAKAGQQLSTFFPYQKDDHNELSNDISFDS